MRNKLLFFFKSWQFVCLHRSLSTLSQSHKFRSRCPTLTRSRSRSPTKNEDSEDECACLCVCVSVCSNGRLTVVVTTTNGGQKTSQRYQALTARPVRDCIVPCLSASLSREIARETSPVTWSPMDPIALNSPIIQHVDVLLRRHEISTVRRANTVIDLIVRRNWPSRNCSYRQRSVDSRHLDEHDDIVMPSHVTLKTAQINYIAPSSNIPLTDSNVDIVKPCSHRSGGSRL